MKNTQPLTYIITLLVVYPNKTMIKPRTIHIAGTVFASTLMRIDKLNASIFTQYQTIKTFWAYVGFEKEENL